MGIKGIYGEIGPGERIAFSKLAIEKLEKTGEPFRVAIDVSIWQFQTQSGQGGSNPAIRTFYYRLLRLLSVSVQPVFIFDGPNKPTFKRGKRSHYGGASVSDMLTKEMLTLFGFPFYRAPGEAEAECALLQRSGIVDAVLSEDVDTLMFGCGQTLRNWSSEGTRGNKSPTHVSVYNAKATKEGSSGLDREGMVLVALMSGGDYTEGIAGCGIKVACQAARAGYGKSLCQIPQADDLRAWRENLIHELRTNQSKYFRTKHTTLQIDENWPDRKILGYYTHPVVSSAARIERLKSEFDWDAEIDIPGLRDFVAKAFDWTSKPGAIKFIRGLAPVLLVHKLLLRRNRRSSGYGDIVLTAMNEMELVRSIAAERKHFSTDAMRELRLVYMPIEIVGLDLGAEHDEELDYDRDGLAPLGEDDQVEAYVEDDDGKTGKGASQYDPTQLDKAWVSVTIAKIGIPLKVEDYEESLTAPKKVTKAKPTAKKAASKKTVMPKGAMDRFVSTTKPVERVLSKPASPDYSDDEDLLPPSFLAPRLEKPPVPRPKASETGRSSSSPTRSDPKSAAPSKPRPQSRTSSLSKPTHTHPWSLPTTSTSQTTRNTKPNPNTTSPSSKPKPIVYSLLSSSPIAPSPPPKLTPKRQHSPSPSPPISHKRDSLASLDAHEELGLPSTVTISRHRSGRSRSRRQRSHNTPRNQSPSRPSPRKKITSSPFLADDTGGLGDGSSFEHQDQGVARKIDFAAAASASQVETHLPTSSPLTSAFSSFVEQDLNLGFDSDEEALSLPKPKPKAPNVGREVQARQRVIEIIDLSSSPPQPAPAKYKGSSKIHSFFNSSKATHSQAQALSVKASVDAMVHEHEAGNGSRSGNREEVRERKKDGKEMRKKVIVARESLPGAWKKVDEDEEDVQSRIADGVGGVGRVKREGRWRMSEVEVLDLSQE